MPVQSYVRYNRLKDIGLTEQRFVSDAAHQLRTPLAVLQTQLQSGLEGAVDPLALIREMQGTVRRATALSQQMLSLARVQQLHSQGAASSLHEAVENPTPRGS